MGGDREEGWMWTRTRLELNFALVPEPPVKSGTRLCHRSGLGMGIKVLP